jgi:hypothetical protein
MSEKCPVCLLELGEKNIFITQCGHTFCGSCIIENLKYTTACPLCRGNLVDSNSSDGSVSSDAGDASDADNSSRGNGIDHNDVPNRADLLTIYSDLIVEYVLDAGADGIADTHGINRRETLRSQVYSLLGGFDSDMRLIVSPLSAGNNSQRRLSLSDLNFNQVSNGFESDELDEIDEIISRINIPR